MPTSINTTNRINIRDINPLEHLTSDLSKAMFNYKSMLNGLVEWNNSKLANVTVRLMCDADPGIVDYTFPTKKSSDGFGTNAADPDTDAGAFSYLYKIPLAGMVAEYPEYNDKIDLRVTVTENGGSTWQVWANAAIYDEQYNEIAMADETNANIEHESDDESGDIIVDRGAMATMEYLPGQFVRINHMNDGSAELRWVHTKITAGNEIDMTNTSSVFEKWSLSRIEQYATDGAANHMFVVYGNKVYRPTGSISTLTPDVDSNGWTYYCDVLDDTSIEQTVLEHGKIYLYVHPCHKNESNPYSYAELYMYNGTYTQYGYLPYDTHCETECSNCTRIYNTGWAEHPVLLFPISVEFATTASFRWTVTTDIESIVLKRITDGETGALPEITVKPSVRIVEKPSEDNGGLSIFDTSNYAAWPATSPKWSLSGNYSTDVSRGIYEKQDYTATMIFDHANPNCKQHNIINYNGPDLDMGLAIYLPVESSSNGNLVRPKNGRSFDFVFRIWPNPAYNGRDTADLIINKAQIYVYSIASTNDIDRSGGSIGCNAKLLAKFSMARVTNFYVFSENIAVPNRPVIYKASFVYSSETDEWTMNGYYQFPDCVFLSPAGFVDPSNRSANPYGVETAGFPLMQDPFSNYDLSPVMVDEKFHNRIE